MSSCTRCRTSWRSNPTKMGLPARLSTGMSKKPWIWEACRSMVSTRSAPAAGEHIGHQLGGDGIAGLGLAVLTGIAEVGDDGGDAAGGCPLSASIMMSSSIRFWFTGLQVD